MSRNIPSNFLQTRGYVLRRTNYGEADRILDLITPQGKIAVIARGVRREKSKLAGMVEMFSLVDFSIHRGKGELGVLTGAKMINFFDEILGDVEKLELAGWFLKKINVAAEGAENGEYFEILDQGLTAINIGVDLRLIRVWFWLNLLRASGEELNLFRDVNGDPLDAHEIYRWDEIEMAMRLDAKGKFGANEIKMLRLMTANRCEILIRVKTNERLIETIDDFAKQNTR